MTGEGGYSDDRRRATWMTEEEGYLEPQLWINQRSKAEKYRAFSIALNKK